MVDHTNLGFSHLRSRGWLLFFAFTIGSLLSCGEEVITDSGLESEDPNEILYIQSITPDHGATEVAIDSSFRIRFSKDLDLTSITVNSSDNNCSGVIQLSTATENFSKCIPLQIKSNQLPTQQNKTNCHRGINPSDHSIWVPTIFAHH